VPAHIGSDRDGRPKTGAHTRPVYLVSTAYAISSRGLTTRGKGYACRSRSRRESGHAKLFGAGLGRDGTDLFERI